MHVKNVMKWMTFKHIKELPWQQMNIAVIISVFVTNVIFVKKKNKKKINRLFANT